MSAASLPLQAAIKSALDAALSATVYDRVPQDVASFPYVVIGDDDVDDWSVLAREGEDIDFTIHVWSRYAGRKEAKEIMASIKDALHEKKLTVTGWTMASMRMTFATSFLEPDGKTTHGVIRFRALLARD